MAASPSSPKLNFGTRGLLRTRRPHLRDRREQFCQSEKVVCGTLLSSGGGQPTCSPASRLVLGRPPRLGVHNCVRRGEAYFGGCEGAAQKTSGDGPGQRQLLQRRRCSGPSGATERLAKELAREGYARRRELQRRRQSGFTQGKVRKEDQEVCSSRRQAREKQEPGSQGGEAAAEVGWKFRRQPLAGACHRGAAQEVQRQDKEKAQRLQLLQCKRERFESQVRRTATGDTRPQE